LRDVPFLGLGEIVAGIDCAPLTLRKVIWLQLTKSPFLYDIPAEDLIEKPNLTADIISFYWIVSKEFEAGNKRKRKQFDKRIKPLLKKDVSEVVKGIASFMDESWMDSGRGDGGRSFYSTAASLTIFFAKNYGQSLDVWENSRWRRFVRVLTGKPNALDIPLKIGWQLMRAHRNASEPTTFENRLTDAAIAGWHKEDNLRLKRELEAREKN
jgi:hypothetical protein